MTLFYDARGNIYAVVSPAFLRTRGVDVPDSAAQAAAARKGWTAAAIASECGWGRVPNLRTPRPTVAMGCWSGRFRLTRHLIC